MSRLARFENKSQRVLREISASVNSTWGTTVPFKFGKVGFAINGFADIPVVGFQAYTSDPAAIIPSARQHILRAVFDKKNELNLEALSLTVTLGIKADRRRFVDQNDASQSFGKNKMGRRVMYYLEITMPSEVPAFREAFGRVYL